MHTGSGEKQKRKRKSKPGSFENPPLVIKFLFGIIWIIGVNFTFMICLVMFFVILLIAKTSVNNRAPADFCTTVDPFYQAYVENVDSWVEYFRQDDFVFILRHDLSNSTHIDVLAEGWQNRGQNEPVLFSILASAGNPNFSRLGQYGYIFNPAFQTIDLESYDVYYDYQHIADDIYCYYKTDTRLR